MTPLPILLIHSAAAWAPDAPRYWPKYGGSRQVRLLDGAWRYGFIDGWDSGFDSMNASFRPSDGATPNMTSVPSCMDVVAGGAGGYLGPRGVGLFRTSFRSPAAGSAVRLQFQSCSFYCRVWVNGREVGDHLAGGYVAFALDVPADALSPDGGGENELFVLADNRFNATTAPMHTGGDFWHYGGITRSVELHAVPEAGPLLWRAHVVPSSSAVEAEQPDGAPAAVDISLVLSGVEGGREELKGQGELGGKAESGGAVGGSPRCGGGAACPAPVYYFSLAFDGGEAVARNGTASGGTVSMGGQSATARLTLNGEVAKLVGWNHHTQWPASPTDEQLDADIALLRKGGANLVRGAHYPHDPRWLDRLDEAGILFWSETLGPAVSVANTKDWAFFMVHQKRQLSEMIDNAINHAAVFAWGWSGACYEHASLVAFNDYPGWYSSKSPRVWDGFAAAVAEGTTASGRHTVGKPMMISETGAALPRAGGVYEWGDNATASKWTLQYQSAVIGEDVDVALANDRISGISLWHFYDFKENGTHCTYDHPPPTTFEELRRLGPPNCTAIAPTFRPGGTNHKGVLDFWRRPKPAFAMVAAKCIVGKSRHTGCRCGVNLFQVEAEKRAKGKKGKKKKKGGGAGAAGPSQEAEEGAEAPSEAAEAAKKAEEERMMRLLEKCHEERMRFGITAASQAAASAEVAKAARLDAAADEAEEEAEAEEEEEAAAVAALADAEVARAEARAAQVAATAAVEKVMAALEEAKAALSEAKAALSEADSALEGRETELQAAIGAAEATGIAAGAARARADAAREAADAAQSDAVA
ncbi:hypothetical protein EMIHUDRAFT_466342 [Emiliania huxleyi CCMP1516]|uniref:Glycoside hydrolase family 2 catalytic domain-containing protein n=2 Tax=Emiliania huxleyi TaxID=2903 RepID=A0A0D3HXG7_EMIH1|nr:hypothetical protein EMIHUDRAFT_466342 [Emiliania huxleyi CCMP1516]EOD03702.1 hypothetical protein EMIHUDRAFT_466342 [Emiliania huxleyi CCMP1516]|eukprot:XP_005756131.1 hypothetical protein EMIHUDRAFT_466342 [Emiliania huxleyi CCMP1516]